MCQRIILKREVIMSFGISGSDPFKSYSTDKDAGGGMGVFAKKRRKNQNKKEDNKKKSHYLRLVMI